MKALLSALVLCLFATFAMANVSTQGTGKVKYVADVGYIQAGVQGEGKTAAEAWEKNREAVKKIFAALQKLGVDPKDIQTTNLNVSPKYDYPKEKAPVLVGYIVSYDLKITVRNLGQVSQSIRVLEDEHAKLPRCLPPQPANMGEILDAIVQAGANRNMHISFGSSNLEKLMEEARTNAVLDARKKAQLYARTAGAGLGQVLSISDHVDVHHYRLAYEHAPQSGMKGLPIATGEQELSVNVSIVYSLVPQQLPTVE